MRNLALGSICLLTTALPAVAWPQAVASQAAVPAYMFWRSIGVNTHLMYNAQAGMADNPYASVDAVVLALKYLGVSSIRDNAAGPGTSAIRQVHNATGALFDIFIGTGWGSDYATQIAWIKANTDLLEAVEGANEVDNWPVTFGGATGYAAAAAQQAQLYADMKGAVPVYATSIGNPANLGGLGNLSGAVTDANAHTYPPGQPDTWLAGWWQKSSTDTPGVTSVVQTEAGWSTLGSANSVGYIGSYSERAQARYTLNLLLDSFRMGSPHTYLYELVDAGYAPGVGSCDPSGSNRELHFGLYRCDWSPKPVADSIHNTTLLVQDVPGGQTGSLAYSLAGFNGHTLLLQKSSGEFILAVWAEPPIFDVNTLQDVAAPVQNVTVTVGTATSLSVYDPLVSDSPQQSTSGTAVSFPVSDHPVYVVIGKLVIADPNAAVAQSGYQTVMGQLASLQAGTTDPGLVATSSGSQGTPANTTGSTSTPNMSTAAGTSGTPGSSTGTATDATSAAPAGTFDAVAAGDAAGGYVAASSIAPAGATVTGASTGAPGSQLPSADTAGSTSVPATINSATANPSPSTGIATDAASSALIGSFDAVAAGDAAGGYVAASGTAPSGAAATGPSTAAPGSQLPSADTGGPTSVPATINSATADPSPSTGTATEATSPAPTGSFDAVAAGNVAGGFVAASSAATPVSSASPTVPSSLSSLTAPGGASGTTTSDGISAAMTGQPATPVATHATASYGGASTTFASGAATDSAGSNSGSAASGTGQPGDATGSATAEDPTRATEPARPRNRSAARSGHTQTASNQPATRSASAGAVPSGATAAAASPTTPGPTTNPTPQDAITQFVTNASWRTQFLALLTSLVARLGGS